jgi:GDPmannose 4,6-dehydratase
MNKTALITGITGQDGSYLAELLLSKGYKVIGTIRRHSFNTNLSNTRISHLVDKIILEYADVTDLDSLQKVTKKYHPDEFYNLAAQSDVRISFDNPVYTNNTISTGTLNVLECIKNISPTTRVYQASSSEMFGNNIDKDGYQRETTPFNPNNPYACSRVFSYNICNTYKEAYDMHISTGIAFNHESPRRGDNFVTTKVVKGAVNIYKNQQDKLKLGNLDVYRDWSHAKDHVNAMWLILQQSTPDNFICSSGELNSLKYLCEYVFSSLGMDYEKYIETDPNMLRPKEIKLTKGDPSKLEKATGWSRKYNFKEMLDEMIEYWKDKL